MPICFSNGLRLQGANDGQIKRNRGTLQSWQVNISRPPEGNPRILWSLGQQHLSLLDFRGKPNTFGPGSYEAAGGMRPAGPDPAGQVYVSMMRMGIENTLISRVSSALRSIRHT